MSAKAKEKNLFYPRNHDSATLSCSMSRDLSKDLAPQLIVRRFNYSKGFHYRLPDKRLPGKPIIAPPQKKVIGFLGSFCMHS